MQPSFNLPGKMPLPMPAGVHLPQQRQFADLFQNAQEGIIERCEIDHKPFVIARTKNGAVIQSSDDFLQRRQTGLYLGFDGTTSLSGSDQGAVLKIAKNFVSNLPLSEGSIDINGTSYVFKQAAQGRVIQKEHDWVWGNKTGLYFGNQGETHFDGDLNCIRVLSRLLLPQPNPVAAVQAAAMPIVKPLAELSDEEFQGVWKSMQIGTPEASSIQKEMFRRLMGDQGLYNSRYRTNLNFKNLAAYIESPEFVAHQRSTKVYVGHNLSPDQAKLMANQREPVNIAQGRGYNLPRAEKLLGYSTSFFETQGRNLDSNAVVSVYSKTFLWDPPGGNIKKEVAVLSVYAPALDSPQQPRFNHYIDGQPKEENNRLNVAAYRAHMQEVAMTIVQAAIDNKDSTRRVVIPLVGQSAFVSTLSGQGKQQAMQIFVETMAEALKQNAQALQGLPIVISEYSGQKGVQAAQNIAAISRMPVGSILGDIKTQSREGDLIVNAWDPHSAPGNGNDGDNSFDGQIGRSTGVLLTQTNWFNSQMNDEGAYRRI